MSTDRDRLIELIRQKPFTSEYENYNSLEWAEHFADHLIANGVIVAPMPMADWLKKELTEHVHQRCMEEL